MNHILQSALAAQAQPQQQGVQIAAPINDVQLVALIAAQLDMETPADNVEAAMEILAEAFVGVQSGDLGRLIQAKVSARQLRN